MEGKTNFIDPEVEAFIRDSAKKIVEEKSNESSRRRTGSQVETFENVLRQGATEIPRPDEISAAFASLMPDMDQDEHIKTFEDVLKRGATEIPQQDQISAAFSSLMPDVDQDPYGSDEEQDASASAEGGVKGLLKTPLSYALNTLRFVGSSINEHAVQPVAAQVAVHAMPAATAWGKYVLALMQDFTPQRAQNLFRIFANAAVNAFGLVQTPSGVKLGDSVKKVSDSFVDVVSSPVGRQMVIESSAGVVKLAEALDTPEAKSAIRHFASVLDRFIDVLSSDECRQLIHNASEAVCRGIELANSPESTVMAAEITANICYALEVESQSSQESAKFGGRGHQRNMTRRSASFTSATSHRTVSHRHSWSHSDLDGVTDPDEQRPGKVAYEDAILHSFHQMPLDSGKEQVAESKDTEDKAGEEDRAVPSDGSLAFPDSVLDELTTVINDEELESVAEEPEGRESTSDKLTEGDRSFTSEPDQSDAPEGGSTKDTFDREVLTRQFRKRRQKSSLMQSKRTSPHRRSEKLESTRKMFQEHLEKKGQSLNLTKKPKRPEEGGLLCCFMVTALLVWSLLALYGLKHSVSNVWSQLSLLTAEPQNLPTNIGTVPPMHCALGPLVDG